MAQASQIIGSEEHILKHQHVSDNPSFSKLERLTQSKANVCFYGIITILFILAFGWLGSLAGIILLYYKLIGLATQVMFSQTFHKA